MRRGKHRKLGRESRQREVLIRSLETALIEHDKIKTTEAKAKTLSKQIDKLVSLAKKNDLPARKLLLSKVGEKAVKKLMSETAVQAKDRNGGYTKITKLLHCYDIAR